VAGLSETILAWDSAVSALGEEVRWAPLTLVFLVASTWFVKWPLIVAVGGCLDARRRCFPRAGVAAALAVTTAASLVTVLKEAFDRARPPVTDPGLDPVGIVPASASFPSGHAATAFAAATAIAILSPRMRPYVLGLAAAVALSRVYLRVHFPLDVVAGALIGAGLGALAALLAVKLARLRAPSPAHANGEGERDGADDDRPGERDARRVLAGALE
jgi:undecaprenyl-diphosphatase